MSRSPDPNPVPFADAPRPSVCQMQRRLAEELSMGSRIRTTLLLLVALAAAAVVASLWLTEPDLPRRTRVAFALLVGVALCWAGVFAWTLSRRQVLLAHHRLVTSRLAVLGCGIFTGGAALLAVTAPALRPTALCAAALGAVMLAVAVVLWRRAACRYRNLEERVRRLQHEVG